MPTRVYVRKTKVNKPGMSREEVRVRLAAAKKIYPFTQICNLAGYRGRNDLYNFLSGRPERPTNRVGPMRLKRLAKICLEIETGVRRWNGEARKKSRVSIGEATRPATVVHRVMFDGIKPALRQGTAPINPAMPSFANLFGEKPRFQLPKVGNSGIKVK